MRRPNRRDSTFFYYEESALRAIRIDQWKVAFGTRDGYYGTSTTHPIPLLVNLRQDPFESFLQAPGPRAEPCRSARPTCSTWSWNRCYQHVGSLKAFPPTQKAASLDVNQIIQSLVSGGPEALARPTPRRGAEPGMPTTKSLSPLDMAFFVLETRERMSNVGPLGDPAAAAAARAAPGALRRPTCWRRMTASARWARRSTCATWQRG